MRERIRQGAVSGAGRERQSPGIRRDGSFWSFSVIDNGTGIEPEYGERIFVIFQRLHDRSAYAGTGIGLAKCPKIIEYYGGRIWFDTGLRNGSRSCFTLPALPDDEETND